jgi:hypothetical protein
LSANIGKAKQGMYRSMRASNDDTWASTCSEAANLLEFSGAMVEAAECYQDLAASSPCDATQKIHALNQRARILREAKHAGAESAAAEVVKVHSDIGGNCVPDGANYESLVRSALGKGDAKVAYETAWLGTRMHRNREECYEVLLDAAGEDVPPVPGGGNQETGTM